MKGSTYGRARTIRDQKPATYQPTERTRVRRLPERGVYDRDVVHAILDEGFICHVGFVADGQPYVIPTGYARAGETLYLHGSTGSRLGLRPGMPVCVTVTLLDGLVLARSAFHHCNDGLLSLDTGEAA